MTLAFELPPTPNSCVARMDPRWKLAALVPAAILVAWLRELMPAAWALIGALMLAQLAQLPFRWLMARLLWTALLLLLFIAWIPFLPDAEGATLELGPISVAAGGMIRAGVILLKTLAIVTMMLIVLATAPFNDTLKAAQRLRVPGLFIQLTLLTFRYVFQLAEEFVRLRTALRVRGFRNRANLHSWRTIGQAGGTLLVRGSERADRVGQAMQARGFDGTFRSLCAFHTRWSDVALGAVILLVAGSLLGWDVWRR